MIDEALAALRDGKFILLYDFDDREGESLICTAVHPVAAIRLGLPFASDALRAIAVAEREGDIPYDRKNHSSFSLWVNHRDTFTGITDRDRALTVNAIAEQVKQALNGGGLSFHEVFRTPGHMALLRAAEGLLDRRKGQTELSIAMAEMAGITPAITICEMLDDESGNALSKADAKLYAMKHGLEFVEGPEVMERWEAEKRSQ
ncbi:MAG: 3,4-dihydroxy-2-butanone-4-phosphate synthase [Methanoregulaceae archaeon]|nr:3,4-dihydroxy-2-butanone-4-phosphate synthase [Methanoregulaceae archaeon]